MSSFGPMAERRNSSSGKLRPLEVFGSDEVDYIPRMRTPLLNRNPPPKTTIAAVLMLLGGIICISIGLSIMFSNVISHGKDRGVAILVLGGLSKWTKPLVVSNGCYVVSFSCSVHSRKLRISGYIWYLEWLGRL